MAAQAQAQAGKAKPNLSQALENFTPVANGLLRWALGALPVLIVILVLLDLLVTREFLTGDVMLLTGLLAAACAMFLLSVQLHAIRDTLRTLWNRGAILSYREPPAPTANHNPFDALLGKARDARPVAPAGPLSSESPPSSEGAATPSLEARYRDYVIGFQDWLNHRAGWGLGLLFAAIIAISFPYRWGIGFTFRWVGSLFGEIDWVNSSGILGQVVMAYLIGLLGWRMIAIAMKISQLGVLFNLDVKIQHPDKSGGLKPLGDLCFLNALIVTIPGIFLGGWILAIPRLGFPAYLEWVGFFRQLLLLVFVLAILAFFQPLYAVHQAMLRQRVLIQQQLDELSKKIDGLSRQLLEEADRLGPEKGEQIGQNITHLRQLYESNQTVPVWPFDKALIVKFATSQAVPLLSLTNIGPTILNLVDYLLKLFQ
jgi:hypothetical protein